MATAPNQEQLFKAYADGSEQAVAQILAAEHGALFDFLLRMTGQSPRATDTIDEVFSAIEAGNQEFASLEKLRVCLYQTARSFSADIWNADTSQLVNQALTRSNSGGANDAGGSNTYKKAELEAFLNLEQTLRLLPGEEREAVLLRYRHGFKDTSLAEIAGVDSAVAAEHLAEGESTLTQALSIGKSKLEQTMRALPLHPLPVFVQSGQTTNLSLLINDLKESRQTRFSAKWPTVLVIIGVLAALAWYFEPDWLMKLLATVVGKK